MKVIKMFKDHEGNVTFGFLRELASKINTFFYICEGWVSLDRQSFEVLAISTGQNAFDTFFSERNVAQEGRLHIL